MSTLKLKKVKLKGNESFNIREGWLRKGMRCVEESPDLFSRDDVMERLGVGSKMVKSIRYWLQATNLCEEKYINSGRARAQVITDFGRVVEKYDRFFDDIFTLSLIHYHIVSNETMCAVWNIFFNSFEAEEFTRENVVDMCRAELSKRMDEGASFSDSLFIDDCISVLKMYTDKVSSEDPEESLGSPFADLGLVKKASTKNTYRKSPPPRACLDKMAVLYVMMSNLREQKRSVSINELLTGENNVGRVFNLNRVLINEYLDQLRAAGYIDINRTAGLDMVYIREAFTPKDAMEAYYKEAEVR
jgi:hypothetical protein